MNKRNSIYCVNLLLCDNLLSKLRELETKCDRITIELSEVRKLIASLPPDIGTFIDSIECSAKAMLEQSVKHRQYVEKCINGKPNIHLVRRDGDGL